MFFVIVDSLFGQLKSPFFLFFAVTVVVAMTHGLGGETTGQHPFHINFSRLNSAFFFFSLRAVFLVGYANIICISNKLGSQDVSTDLNYAKIITGF